jgi:hypothetical protein
MGYVGLMIITFIEVFGELKGIPVQENKGTFPAFQYVGFVAKPHSVSNQYMVIA